MTEVKHFLDLDRLSPDILRQIIYLAAAYKKGDAPSVGRLSGTQPLAGRTLAMIFEKPSTRTRVSFEVGMKQLGGEVVTLGSKDSQLGRGETIADTARVLSRYVDAIMIRTGPEAQLLDLADSADVPVINGLTDRSHPCQLMADILTFEEHRGPISGKTVAWVGDGNNVAASWIHAAVQFGFKLQLACPDGLHPTDQVLGWSREKGGDITLFKDASKAVAGADCVVTDTWVSMGDENADERRRQLGPYQVNEELMAGAKADALFMHCLPAHRGEEVTEMVIDGPQSVVWDEAENRLHAQKGILAWCLS